MVGKNAGAQNLTGLGAMLHARVPQAYERGKGLATAMLATGSSSPCVVVSSPFLRCIQTAAEVLKGIQFVYGKQEGGQVDTRVAPTVLHLDFGLSEMQTERQMKHCKPTYLSKRELGEIEDGLDEILNRWVGEDDAETGQGPPGYPETQEVAVRRYREAFTRILSRFPESNVVCVTHGDGVASFMAQTGFTTSKDNVYETPVSSFCMHRNRRMQRERNLETSQHPCE
jgi:broad specificity phosphatase PhoE